MSFGPDLVRLGTRDRLAPMLATAFATAATLAPIAIAGRVAGIEVVWPMVIVILGGLVTSTILNLVVVPALYLRLGPAGEPDMTELLADVVPDREPQLIGGR